eukprot:scaffold14086_cov18-Tisochrysis_lutea.AAC.1
MQQQKRAKYERELEEWKKKHAKWEAECARRNAERVGAFHCPQACRCACRDTGVLACKLAWCAWSVLWRVQGSVLPVLGRKQHAHHALLTCGLGSAAMDDGDVEHACTHPRSKNTHLHVCKQLHALFSVATQAEWERHQEQRRLAHANYQKEYQEWERRQASAASAHAGHNRQPAAAAVAAAAAAEAAALPAAEENIKSRCPDDVCGQGHEGCGIGSKPAEGGERDSVAMNGYGHQPEHTGGMQVGCQAKAAGQSSSQQQPLENGGAAKFVIHEAGEGEEGGPSSLLMDALAHIPVLSA